MSFLSSELPFFSALGKAVGKKVDVTQLFFIVRLFSLEGKFFVSCPDIACH
jgi:hypothetical protein